MLFFLNMLIEARGTYLSLKMLPLMLLSAISYSYFNELHYITLSSVGIVLCSGCIGLLLSDFTLTHKFTKFEFSKKIGRISLLAFIVLFLLTIDINISRPENSILCSFGSFFMLGTQYTGLND